jgi:hypothetical protein
VPAAQQAKRPCGRRRYEGRCGAIGPTTLVRAIQKPAGSLEASAPRGTGSRMPQPRGPASSGTATRSPLTRVDVVGRDGIEPPTLRFSVAGRSVQQGAGSAMVLVRWHVTEQAWAGFGRILVDRDVDRGRNKAVLPTLSCSPSCAPQTVPDGSLAVAKGRLA